MNLLGFFHSLINTIFGTMVVLFLMACGQVKSTTWQPRTQHTLCWLMKFKSDGWLLRTNNICGLCCGNWVIVDIDGGYSEKQLNHIFCHEEGHVVQQYMFGVFQAITYWIMWLFVRTIKHLDNHDGILWEQWADEYADRRMSTWE